MEYLPLLDGLGLVALLIGIVIVAFCEELSGPVVRWLQERRGLVDSEQSPPVRRCALRLTSLRHKERLRAGELLGEMNDRTAVPALIRAMGRYRRDGAFLESAVRSLAKLGDARSIPALRELTTGRHQRLMQAAREAIGAIEPASVLLRAAPESESLLRPAGRGENSESQHLLRAPRL